MSQHGYANEISYNLFRRPSLLEILQVTPELSRSSLQPAITAWVRGPTSCPSVRIRKNVLVAGRPERMGRVLCACSNAFFWGSNIRFSIWVDSKEVSGAYACGDKLIVRINSKVTNAPRLSFFSCSVKRGR